MTDGFERYQARYGKKGLQDLQGEQEKDLQTGGQGRGQSVRQEPLCDEGSESLRQEIGG